MLRLAQILFGKWRDEQKVRLFFWGQTIDVLNVQNAFLDDITYEEDGGSVVHLLLRSSHQLCNTGRMGADGVAVRDTDCAEANMPVKHSNTVTMQVEPPNRHPPKIVCHDDWPPPPPSKPPPLPSPPLPPPPPPPPPPASILASGECLLGGTTTEDGRTAVGGVETAKLVVRPSVWQDDFIVIVGLIGPRLKASHAVRAVS